MHTHSNPTLDTLLINLLPGVGIHRYWQLIEHYGSTQSLLASPAKDIYLISRAAKQLLQEYQHLGDTSQLMQQAQTILEQVDRHQTQLISVASKNYPSLLKEIHQPPPLLYIKGEIDNLILPQLAIVGSRHATYGGLENTRLFSQHLCQHGFTITSGLALGIDGAAHQAALEQQGKTIAVMATGIDRIYPQKHRYIADKIIAQGGTLVTEFAPNTPPIANHFPRRNRIISGLSLGVIVVEAAVKSGSLITARYALEQGREVFAIPGSIHNPQSKGCHQLIKQGAVLIENSVDIIEHLQGGLEHIASHRVEPSPHTSIPLTDEEGLILEHIGFKPTTIDQLLHTTQLSSQAISANLSRLEINGLIKQSDWGYERV